MLKVLSAITLVSVLTLGPLITGCSSEVEQSPRVGYEAPDFQFQNPNGKSAFLSDLRGSPVVLNFWTTWCGPCVFEMPFLQEVHEEWADKGLVLLAINVGESASKVNDFLQTHDLSLTVILDTRQTIAQQYNIRAIPATFFIDRNGIIQIIKIGAFQNKTQIENGLSKIIP